MLGEMDSTDLDDTHWDAAQEGAEMLREGDREGAIALLTSVIQGDPTNPYGYFWLGAAYFEQQDLLKALKAYLSCVEIKPDYLGASLGLGRTLHALGRHRDALRVGRQILHKNKQDGDALHLMGVCHFAMGDKAAARDYLERFLETRPELEAAMEIEGMLKVLRGEVEPAEEMPDEGL